MAYTLGVECGFCSSAPVANPGGSDIWSVDGGAAVTADTAPVGATKITEIGWWMQAGSDPANFEVGVYAEDGADNGPSTLLHADRTNAKGTTQGWMPVVGLNFEITESTRYWLAVQVDNTGIATTSYSDTTAESRDWAAMDTLNNPFGALSLTADASYALYAVWEAAGGERVHVECLGSC